jgi:hypothetical protein
MKRIKITQWGYKWRGMTSVVLQLSECRWQLAFIRVRSR